jgi:flagellar biosynthesis/type III secretory pathway protein FliH
VGEFVSLEHRLSARRDQATASPCPGEERAAPVPFDPPAARLIAELSHLRLAAIEAFERASGRLAERFAEEVLGRELLLAPCDLEAIARQLIAEFQGDEPVALITAQGSAGGRRAPGGLPLEADPSLGPGDVLLRVRDGMLDARLTVRAAGACAAISVS